MEVETGCLSGLEENERLIFEPIWAWSQNYWLDIFNIQEDYTYFYFVTAKDATSHESDQSNITNTYIPVGGLAKSLNGFPGVVVPKIFFLYQNYPNPFNPSTEIKYTLAKDSYVIVKIYDMLGTEVTELVTEPQAAGNYEISFNANNLSSGVYIYRITASKNGRIVYTDAKQMILLR